MKKLVKIEGMTCEGCASTVHEIFSSIEGVQTVKVSLAEASAEIEAKNDITMQQLQDAIDAQEANYEVSE